MRKCVKSGTRTKKAIGGREEAESPHFSRALSFLEARFSTISGGKEKTTRSLISKHYILKFKYWILLFVPMLLKTVC